MGSRSWLGFRAGGKSLFLSLMPKKRFASPEHADTLSLKALRELVTGLLGEVRELSSEVKSLRAENIAQRDRRADAALVAKIRSHEPQRFCNQVPFLEYLASKGIDIFDRQAVRVLAEAGIWRSIRHHGLLGDTVIVSDDAGQFRVGNHALCWVHAERLLQKLMPATPRQVRLVETVRDLMWRFYRALKSVKRTPSPGLAAAFHERFSRIFSLRSGYDDLDKLSARLARRKDELLKVLDRPDIPLHTNASENDLRSFVTKRKISGGTVSRHGRVARDTMLGLMKTCRKLGLSFWHYLGDRLGLDSQAIPPLAALVAARA